MTEELCQTSIDYPRKIESNAGESQNFYAIFRIKKENGHNLIPLLIIFA